MKVIVPYVYNWEGKIEQKLLEKASKSESELTNEILSIMQDAFSHVSEGFEYYDNAIHKLDDKLDQLDQKVTAIEGDVKINRKLIDAITFVKNSKGL